MEALEFMKEAKRMCLTIGCCSDCNLGYGCAIDGVKNLPDIVLESNCLVVEQWSKDHPIVTNAQKFKEVFGQEPQSINGIIFCPPVTPGAFECDRVDCMKCLEWWDKQYKEPENA